MSANEQSPPIPLIPRWVRTGFWAVADQGLFSISNFLVAILLARWLPSSEQYGAFTIAFAIFLSLGVLHNAFITQPLMVFGPDHFRSRLREYLGSLLYAHLAVTLGGAVVLAIVAGLCWFFQPILLVPLMGIAVFSPLILFLWLMRRTCYLQGLPHRAAEGGAIYLALTCAALAVLRHYRLDSLLNVIAVMGIASLLSGLWLALREGLRFPASGLANPIVREMAADHWRFGRWAAAAGMVSYLLQQASYMIVGAVSPGGLADAGTLRAIYNLVQPLLLANVALCVLLVPTLVRKRGTASYATTVRLAVLGLVAGSVLYWAILCTFHAPVMSAIYQGKYADDRALMWLLGFHPVLTAIFGVYNAVLESSQRPDRVFYGGLVSAIASIVLGIAFTMLWGLHGIAASLTLCFALNALISYLLAKPQVLENTARPVRGERWLAELLATPTPAPERAVRPLFIAFAAEPGKGSEPAVGWHTITAAAALYPVWAIVHPMHRNAIEGWLARNDASNIHVSYYTLPRWLDWMLCSFTGLNIYYYFWQICVVPSARRLHHEHQFDVAHHVTYARYWMPSAAARLGIPYIIGPVGGGEGAPPEFYRSLGFYGWFVEQCRRAARWMLEFDPQVESTLSNAGVCFATSHESARRMRKLGASNVIVRSSIGPLTSDAGSPETEPDRPFRMIAIGRLLHWKGFHLAIEAFARSGLREAELVICGKGPAQQWLERRACRLGVADRVRFTGEVPREQVVALLHNSDLLIHPSLHESGGFVVLEAMEQGKPVVCLDLGGPAVHVNDSTGLRVAANTLNDAIDELSSAIRQLHADPNLCRRLGCNGLTRAREEFGWDNKARVYDRCYRQLIADKETVAVLKT